MSTPGRGSRSSASASSAEFQLVCRLRPVSDPVPNLGTEREGVLPVPPAMAPVTARKQKGTRIVARMATRLALMVLRRGSGTRAHSAVDALEAPRAQPLREEGLCSPRGESALRDPKLWTRSERPGRAVP